MRWLLLTLVLLPLHAQPVGRIEPAVIQNHQRERTQTTFVLQLFVENPADTDFVTAEAENLRALVSTLAPHVSLTLEILPAVRIERQRFQIAAARYDVPNHRPTRADATALLITREPLQAQGYAGPSQGVVSVTLMRAKLRTGGAPADILIHEWLHTIVGRRIDGRTIPHPHENARYGFVRPTRRDAAGEDNWDDWYTYLLR